MAARMRFGRSMEQALDQAVQQVDRRETGRTFPADEVVWGFVVRPGFDELDDPFYHRGTTQHAYLEGNDLVAICGFRPPRSGPRTRRRSRLGLPTAGTHPMCGMCARKVVAPRPRIGVPVTTSRPAVAMRVATHPRFATATVGAPAPVPSGRPTAGPVPAPPAPVQPPANGQAAATSPWVRRASAEPTLKARGVHADVES
jgi:hypothetical protein